MSRAVHKEGEGVEMNSNATVAGVDGTLRIGMSADHGGFELKERLRAELSLQGHQITDFGAFEQHDDDDFPDYVVPMARAVAEGRVDRGIAICGSGVGACIAANKVRGVRASLIHDLFSARQGVEDDDMNVLCLGGKVTDLESARGLVSAFLAARFSGSERFRRRLGKIAKVESLETKR